MSNPAAAISLRPWAMAPGAYTSAPNATSPTTFRLSSGSGSSGISANGSAGVGSSGISANGLTNSSVIYYVPTSCFSASSTDISDSSANFFIIASF